MSTEDRDVDPDQPTCIGCGFRSYFNADKGLHTIQITIEGDDWPEMHICDDCAERMAADLGYAHLLPEEVSEIA
ncbi:MAG: hypothetical protein ABEI86_06255 [Halobacteriaceae archaeon]